MNLDNFNNLIELFFYQAEKQKPESIFLEWLNPNNRKNFSWAETKQNIFKLSKNPTKNGAREYIFNTRGIATFNLEFFILGVLNKYLKASFAKFGYFFSVS